MTKPFFIIIGLPRSGTSLVAGILHNSGIKVTKSRIRYDKYNSKGYYEYLPMVNINVLLSKSKTFNNFILAMKNNNIKTIVDEYNHCVDQLIIKDNLNGMKDPRFCFVELLNGFINTMKFRHPTRNVKIILTHRNIISIANSVLHVDPTVSMEKNELISILETFYSNAFDNMRHMGYEYMMVSYERLISDYNESLLNELADFCEIKPNDIAKDFIDRSLKRF